MNRALLNPFEADKLPDNLELYLDSDYGHTTCMAFNRHGNVLAVGCAGGRIALWDFDTRASDQYPAVVLGDQDDPLIMANPPYRVTAVAFAAPRHGHVILASFSSPRAEKAPGRVRMLETMTGRVICEVLFDAPIATFVSHPSRPDVLVVLPVNLLPLLLRVSPGQYEITAAVYDSPLYSRKVFFLPAIDRDASTEPGNENMIVASVLCPNDQSPDDEKCSSGKRELDLSCPASAADTTYAQASNARRQRSEGFVVAFSKRGEYVLRGGPDGVIHIFATNLKRHCVAHSALPAADCRVAECNICGTSVINTFKVPGGASIKSLTLVHNRLLVNSGDRSMRLFDAGPLLQEVPKDQQTCIPTVSSIAVYTEAVNRLQCRCACFSRDGDFVLGGMAGNDHRIHVWRTSDGHLQTTLEGPTEGILDILWHPVHPVIVSIGASFGGIYVWAKNFTENWSAFAPDFTELEANEEYDEPEDEFDAKDPHEDVRIRAEREQTEESIVVDVETYGPSGFSSSSEDELEEEEKRNPCVLMSYKGGQSFYLPAIPVPDSNLEYPMVDANGMTAQRHRERIKERCLNDRGGRQRSSNRTSRSSRSSARSTGNTAVHGASEMLVANSHEVDERASDCSRHRSVHDQARKHSKPRRSHSIQQAKKVDSDQCSLEKDCAADGAVSSTRRSCPVKNSLNAAAFAPPCSRSSDIDSESANQSKGTSGSDDDDLHLQSDRDGAGMEDEKFTKRDVKKPRLSTADSSSEHCVTASADRTVSGSRPPLIPTEHVDQTCRK